MNAIIPINVTALRVSRNDNDSIVGKYKGRVAYFENMPYHGGKDGVSTGDAIVRPLEIDDSAIDKLGIGVHLHWELPDYFKKGVQTPDNPVVTFPQAPNRWLVTRYLTLGDDADETKNTWGEPTTKSWVIESDYVTESSPLEMKDETGVSRPTTSVPLEIVSPQPFGYMGRVQYVENWDPDNVTTHPENYLPAYQMEDGTPTYLNSIGFLGPGFSAYYPDCCSIFGFWDHFQDDQDVYNRIVNNSEIPFKVSYQVVGWIDGGINDPLDGIADLVTQQYNDYITQSKDKGTTIDQTPADYYANILQSNLGWEINPAEITYTTDAATELITSLTSPEKTICNGVIQEIVWNLNKGTGNASFLQNPETAANSDNGAFWIDTIDLAIGNTPLQALSALLKSEMGNTDDYDEQDEDDDVLNDYEYLLDALQLNLLNDLENQNNKFIELEESLHSNGFSKHQGGLIWVVQQNPTDPNQQGNVSNEITLPTTLAEQLNVLNTAQKNYDTGRALVDGLRKQLYMDWFRYVHIFNAEEQGKDPGTNVSLDDLEDFLQNNNNDACTLVVNAGNDVGILSYILDADAGSIINIDPPQSAVTSKAYLVYQAFQAFKTAMADYPNWNFFATPSSPFWMPTDPVAVIEGNKIEPIIRNGTAQYLSIRSSSQLFDALIIDYNSQPTTINPSDISTVLNNLQIPTALPYQNDIQSLIDESLLLIPTFANTIGNILNDKVGGNLTANDLANFISALQSAQGGLSPLDNGTDTGLYNAIRQEGYIAEVNPSQSLTTPLSMDITFTNTINNGWAPNPIAWSAQQQYINFDTNRYDPFLPVNLVWELGFQPLLRDGSGNYDASILKDKFQMDTDNIDYQYLDTNLSNTFNPSQINYTGSIFLSKNTSYSLTKQIDNYKNQYPNDTETIQVLDSISDYYNDRNYMSQTMSGFNIQQALRNYIAQIPLANLTEGPRDDVTTYIGEAITTAAGTDNWYDTSFNSQLPIDKEDLATYNFGPLRAGFMEMQRMKIVDVFGQVLQTNTNGQNTDGPLEAISAIPVKPVASDTINANKVYLPPRLVVPSRLWFRWLSAEHNNEVNGISADFVEMNTHPSTSPVFGWVLPNHLDNSLFFYQSDGSAIGSLGIEHGTLMYRTRVGNSDNLDNILSEDIGVEGSPSVNPHLANFLWYLNGKTPAFLEDMMAAIANSDQFINPANHAQNASLSVLIGRPLALTRAIIGLETEGNLLPLNQSDEPPAANISSPWADDINNGRTDYMDRMTTSSASLGELTFPIRLGDLTNLDDGLVGYLIESSDPMPYDIFYAPAATAGQQNGVEVPAFDSLQKQLNAVPDVLTLLVDPRANVHATVGVLPVEELGIPFDQYSKGMQSLEMTFFTMPVLNERQQLTVPLPKENGYLWSWVKPENTGSVNLKDQAANGNAVWDFSPQTAIEGWLRLTPDNTTPGTDPEPTGD